MGRGEETEMGSYNDITELIGNTPMVRLNHVTGGISAEIRVKLESANPGNSVKDRIGLAMIEAAEKAGVITPGRTVIVEPTSGNTGIALAMVSAVKGYQCVLVMPEQFSPERRVVLRAFGARLVLTEKAKGMPGAIEKANQLASEIPNSFMPQQFENPANPEIHRKTTAEITSKALGKTADANAVTVTRGSLTHLVQLRVAANFRDI